MAIANTHYSTQWNLPPASVWSRRRHLLHVYNELAWDGADNIRNREEERRRDEFIDLVEGNSGSQLNDFVSNLDVTSKKRKAAEDEVCRHKHGYS